MFNGLKWEEEQPLLLTYDHMNSSVVFFFLYKYACKMVIFCYNMEGDHKCITLTRRQFWKFCEAEVAILPGPEKAVVSVAWQVQHGPA